MKRLLMVLLLSASFAVIQAMPLAAQEPPKPNLLKTMRQQTQAVKGLTKTLPKQLWNNEDMIAPTLFFYLSKPEGRKSFGVSEEQFNELQKKISTPVQEGVNAEYDALSKQVKEAKEAKDDQKATELQMQLGMIQMKLASKRLNEEITPELKQKFKETQLATIEFNPFVASSAYEALGISAEQKTKIDSAYKELEPTFEKTLGEIIERSLDVNEKVFDELEKQNVTVTDFKEFGEKVKAAQQYLMETDPEFKKGIDDAMNQLKHLTVQHKFKVYDLLTDEQLKKLQDLTENPPEYVKAVMDQQRQMREMMSKTSNNAASPLDSWKPGEPIPAEYKEHRKKAKAFPSQE